ncbi:methylaspartate mutase subunit S [Salmonella enterica subsp. diarizonae]|nr:methylaspartate mutase subunit S [Salmonella enterica subsp. diarizonae]
MKKSTLVIGVIGADCHAVGNKVLDRVFTAHDFRVINLGVMVNQDEYIDAAIETGADAIVVSSIYGHGDIDCLGLRERCIERASATSCCMSAAIWWSASMTLPGWKQNLKEMGFNRVFAPSHDLEDVCQLMANDINQRHGVEQHCLEEAL